MDQSIVAFSIKAFLKEAHQRLEIASATVTAAVACAEARQPARAVEIANEIDDPLHDAERLIGMAAALARLASTERSGMR